MDGEVPRTRAVHVDGRLRDPNTDGPLAIQSGAADGAVGATLRPDVDEYLILCEVTIT